MLGKLRTDSVTRAALGRLQKRHGWEVLYFRRGSLKAKDGGKFGELRARKEVSVKAERRGLSLERRSFSRTKVCEVFEVAHTSYLCTRGVRDGDFSIPDPAWYRFKNIKVLEARVALVREWPEEADSAGENAGRPGLVSVRGDALRARVPAQLSSLAPIGCS